VRLSFVAAFCAFGCAVQTTRLAPIAAYEQRRLESSVRVINVRKIANRVSGVSSPTPVPESVADGFAQARILWRNRWTWHNGEHHRDMNYGLSGGPVLSVGVPIGDSGVSVEGRCAALRYAMPEDRFRSALPEERMRDREDRTSLEGGLYLNFPFGAR
jgi:hypothetical protein